MPRTSNVPIDGPFHGPHGKERPIHIGKNVLGSYVAGPAETNTPDTIVNTSGRSLLIRRVHYGSTYNGAHGYSRDTCLYLNRMMIAQADDNDDGELVCTYTDAPTDPIQNFRDTGILIRPGERITFHATPRWGKNASGHPLALNEFIWAELDVSEVDGAFATRRVRFPKWDTAYQVKGNFFLGAGNESVIPTPVTVPPGKPKQNSNWWYLNPKNATIRGISIFMSNGLASGIQSGRACVKVVAQDGSPLAEPNCLELRADKFGPEAFNQAFGSGQQGSAFIRFDQSVPADALIGVDFTLTSEGRSDGLDMASYLWIDDSAAGGEVNIQTVNNLQSKEDTDKNKDKEQELKNKSEEKEKKKLKKEEHRKKKEQEKAEKKNARKRKKRKQRNLKKKKNVRKKNNIRQKKIARKRKKRKRRDLKKRKIVKRKKKKKQKKNVRKRKRKLRKIQT